MKNNRSILILLIILICLLIGAYYIYTNPIEEKGGVQTMERTPNDLGDTSENRLDADLPAPSANNSAYLDGFDLRLLDQYTHNLIFFHASWCPTCRSLDADINANFDQIPIETAIYKVDYDSAMDLREKYNITVQHTIISVDKAGNLLKKTAGNASLAEIVNEHL